MAENDDSSFLQENIFENLAGQMNRKAVGEINEIGQRIRYLRKARNISLQELAKITGFSVSRLETMEKGGSHPQLGDMMRLSKALDAAVGPLVSGMGRSAYAITRKGDRKQIYRSSSDADGKKIYSYTSLAPEVQDRHMEALIVQLEKTEQTPMTTHDGEEFIFVLEGTVRLAIADETHDLKPGDSAYYISSTAHYITAKSSKATILAVLYE